MPNQIIASAKSKMEKALNFIREEYAKLQTGRANAALVDSVMVENYGTMMPLKGVASISIPESNQIVIQPWSKDQLASVEKAIQNSNLGLNPQNDGSVIRIIIPPLTEDRRKEMVKLVYKYSEDARISIRNARHEAINELKAKERVKEISEDELKGKEKELQKIVDDLNGQIDEISKKKETDVMTV